MMRCLTYSVMKSAFDCFKAQCIECFVAKSAFLPAFYALYNMLDPSRNRNFLASNNNMMQYLINSVVKSAFDCFKSQSMYIMLHREIGIYASFQ